MSVAEEIRKLRKDLQALKLRELSACIDALENRMVTAFDPVDHSARERHDQVMNAIARLADLDGIWERITRIEARERAS
jgi:ribosomal protein S12